MSEILGFDQNGNPIQQPKCMIQDVKISATIYTNTYCAAFSKWRNEKWQEEKIESVRSGYSRLPGFAYCYDIEAQAQSMKELIEIFEAFATAWNIEAAAQEEAEKKSKEAAKQIAQEAAALAETTA